MRKIFFFVLFGLTFSTPSRALTLYVSVNGNDTWTGQPNRPLASLTGARDRIRDLKRTKGLPLGGVVVEVRGGTYQLPSTFELESQDAGTEKSPIIYRARRGDTVRLIGGKKLSGWRKVTDLAQLNRLDESARGQVWQTDLRAAGLKDLPGPQASGSWASSQPGVEFFFQQQPMTLARWPNQGFVKIAGLPGASADTPELSQRGVFNYDGDRPSRWLNQKDVWLHGYWSFDWADQRQRIESIDPATHTIALEKPDHDFGYRKGQWYYAFNVLSELDRPGEWYLDHQTNILYFWPPSPLKTGESVISVVDDLIKLHDVSDVIFSKFTLEVARGTGITIEGGQRTKVSGCVLQNLGSWGVKILGAKQSGVEGCDITRTGDGGIELVGGDRPTLTPSGLYADNNHIHHYSRWNPMYKAGIRVDGVGCRVSHNLIHDAPHMAIGFSGNDNLIEFNEVHSVCYESNDAGMVYAGRNWSMRGNVIRDNYFHHSYGLDGKGCAGVYLDDNFSSASIESNIFQEVNRAVLLGGGRDNGIVNNVFIDCKPALFVDARGLGWRASGEGELTTTLKAMPYQSDLWSTRYPGIATMLQDEPMAPKGNIIEKNIFADKRQDDIEGKALPYLTIRNNFEGDPLFVDKAKNNFQLRSNSPVWKTGFQKIPVEKIGLYQDAERASWPVVHTVRPKP